MSDHAGSFIGVAVYALLTVAQWSGVAGIITAIAAAVMLSTLALMWRKVSQLTHDTSRLTDTVGTLVVKVTDLEGSMQGDD